MELILTPIVPTNPGYLRATASYRQGGPQRIIGHVFLRPRDGRWSYRTLDKYEGGTYPTSQAALDALERMVVARRKRLQALQQ